MPRFVRLLVLASICLLSGCFDDVKPTVPVTPQVVIQPVTKYVAIPEELTKACPVEKPQLLTVKEAVRVARARKDSLVQCNKQLDAIRSLGK